MKKLTLLLSLILCLGVFSGCGEEPVEDRAFIEDGKIYITENGETYPHDAGIYFDEEEQLGFTYDDFAAEDSEGNKSRIYSKDIKCDGDIEAAIDSVRNMTMYDETQSFYTEDWVGNKIYYPNGGVWGNEEYGFYVYSYNGKMLDLEGFKKPTPDSPGIEAE